MSLIDLTPDELLSTTRAVRKRLDFDKSVDMGLIKECLGLALQAPSGSNAQGWHFVVVSDEAKKRQIAHWYQKAFEVYRNSPAAPDKQHTESPKMQQTQERVLDSAAYLAQHIQDVPVLLFACVPGRLDNAEVATNVTFQASTYGSIIPAVWSFMLAGRARGLGSCLTTIHLIHEREIAEILNIPYEEVTQVAMIPVAHTKGTNFQPAPRKPLDTVLHVDTW